MDCLSFYIDRGKPGGSKNDCLFFGSISEELNKSGLSGPGFSGDEEVEVGLLHAFYAVRKFLIYLKINLIPGYEVFNFFDRCADC